MPDGHKGIKEYKMQKQKILVSACLLGENCKYNGKSNKNGQIIALAEKYELIPACAEVLGGLSTPRPPSEIVGNRVISINGEDVTANYQSGAKRVLEIALENGCEIAILKANSPSCGNKAVYDGTFTGTLREGHGICAGLLIKNGIKILNEKEIDKL